MNYIESKRSIKVCVVKCITGLQKDIKCIKKHKSYEMVCYTLKTTNRRFLSANGTCDNSLISVWHLPASLLDLADRKILGVQQIVKRNVSNR